MNATDYILSNANLPFDLGSLDPEADTLFAAVPKSIWEPFNRAEGHSETVLAGDAVSAWIEKNWRNVLPVLSARFPRR